MTSTTGNRLPSVADHLDLPAGTPPPGFFLEKCRASSAKLLLLRPRPQPDNGTHDRHDRCRQLLAYAEATRQSQTAVIRAYIRTLDKELPAARSDEARLRTHARRSV